MNGEIEECDSGFATYHYVSEDTVYITDIYVLPENRRTHLATLLADRVCEKALAKGTKYVMGSVDVRSIGVENSLKTLEGYGMNVHKVNGNMIFYIKEIKKVEA